MKRIFFLLIILLTLPVSAQAPVGKITPKLKLKLSQTEKTEQHLVWIYFTDKGNDIEKYYSNPEHLLSKKSLQRRNKVLAKNSVIDFFDLPLNQNYLKQICEDGFRIKHKSKWFNAVSGYATLDLIQKISEQPFVKKIDMVSKFLTKQPSANTETDESLSKSSYQPEGVHIYNYGSSYTQNSISNIPQVHDLGYNGQGVTICVMDAGFANLSHEVFQNMNIIAMYDFVADTTEIGAHPHGTATLSLLGGFKEGQLIGPAFGANFILARTENDPGSETPAEEDNWIAAMEWADSIGVDITSTSLGYLTFDPPFESYTWGDMDGNTALITKGADIAAGKGIIVVNSAGNSGFNAEHNTLGAPADGDSVITVGSVDNLGVRASYSSVGPTADGRIKPDLMAMGMGPYIATTFLNGYAIGWPGGTSYSCPIVSGVAAMLLSVDPSLSPMEVRDILRQTASNSSNPDNLYGWGIVNALAAVNLILTDVKDEQIPNNLYMISAYPNPFNPTTKVRFNITEETKVKLGLYDVLGNEIMVLLDDQMERGTHELTLDAKGLSSGVYFLRISSGNFTKAIKVSLIK